MPVFSDLGTRELVWECEGCSAVVFQPKPLEDYVDSVRMAGLRPKGWKWRPYGEGLFCGMCNADAK